MGITEAVKQELLPLRQKTDQLIAGVDDILINLQSVFKTVPHKDSPRPLRAFSAPWKTWKALPEPWTSPSMKTALH